MHEKPQNVYNRGKKTSNNKINVKQILCTARCEYTKKVAVFASVCFPFCWIFRGTRPAQSIDTGRFRNMN